VLIAFLGEPFSAAREMLRERLPDDEVRACAANQLPPPPIDVLVPAMCRLDTELMDAARPRLIQQFGAGLEGVDLDAAKARGILVANVPGHRHRQRGVGRSPRSGTSPRLPAPPRRSSPL